MPPPASVVRGSCDPRDGSDKASAEKLRSLLQWFGDRVIPATAFSLGTPSVGPCCFSGSGIV